MRLCGMHNNMLRCRQEGVATFSNPLLKGFSDSVASKSGCWQHSRSSAHTDTPRLGHVLAPECAGQISYHNVFSIESEPPAILKLCYRRNAAQKSSDDSADGGSSNNDG